MSFEKMNESPVFGSNRAPADPLGEERHLRPGASRGPDEVRLGGVAEAGRDQHLAPRRMPAREARRTELRVPPDLVGERGGNGRDAFDDQVVTGLDRRRLGRGRRLARDGDGTGEERGGEKGGEAARSPPFGNEAYSSRSPTPARRKVPRRRLSGLRPPAPSRRRARASARRDGSRRGPRPRGTRRCGTRTRDPSRGPRR